jgi:hypothetical protein
MINMMSSFFKTTINWKLKFSVRKTFLQRFITQRFHCSSICYCVFQCFCHLCATLVNILSSSLCCHYMFWPNFVVKDSAAHCNARLCWLTTYCYARVCLMVFWFIFRSVCGCPEMFLVGSKLIVWWSAITMAETKWGEKKSEVHLLIDELPGSATKNWRSFETYICGKACVRKAKEHVCCA